MKNAFKIICCSLLMFSVNNSLYSSDNSSKDITMDIPSYRKDTLSKFIYKSIEEQNEIISNLYNNIRENKIDKINNVLFNTYEQILQLDYKYDTECLKIFCKNINSPKTKLHLDENTMQLLRYDSKEEIEFATFLLCIRDELNNLYNSKNINNIEEILIKYTSIIQGLHNSIQKTKIYNNYEIVDECDPREYFYNGQNDFRKYLFDDGSFYRIPLKLAIIQNTCKALEYDMNNYNEAHQYKQCNYEQEYKKLIDTMFKCHYRIIRTIDEILYVYTHNISAKNVSNNTYKEYNKFLRSLIARDTLSSFNCIRTFISGAQHEIDQYAKNSNITIYGDHSDNEYYANIIALCSGYILESNVNNKIQNIINDYQTYLSKIQDNTYKEQLGKILLCMSRKLNSILKNEIL